MSFEGNEPCFICGHSPTITKRIPPGELPDGWYPVEWELDKIVVRGCPNCWKTPLNAQPGGNNEL